MVNVTKTYLPSVEKYKRYVDKIFDSGWITNNGEVVKLLEEKLSHYLGVNNILLVSNGTLALQVAYKLLNLKGEVITTPFSFVATSSSLVWEGLKPVFADIDRRSLCIDPKEIPNKITPNTSAILPVHVFGNGCEVEEIANIAKRYNLKVIYDAAHAFNVKYKGESILKHGDISTLSFHATKIFHTIEGGALVINDDKLYNKAKNLINFGIISPTTIDGVGINAKMNEFQAAMGLCVLEDMDYIYHSRKKVYKQYVEILKNKSYLRYQEWSKYCDRNYSYFPVMFNSEEALLVVKEKLECNGIIPRRYFYPSLDTIGYLEGQNMVISNEIAKTILCLPISVGLDEKVIIKICNIIDSCLQIENYK